MKLTPGTYVAVEFSHSGAPPYHTAEGYIQADGSISVGGCRPSPGMLGRVLSQPYTEDWVEHPVEIKAGGLHYATMKRTLCIVFADGSRLWQGNLGGTIVWLTGNGEEQASVLAEAIRRTPAP